MPAQASASAAARSLLQIERYMVNMQALAPTTCETNSAQNTPSAPKPILGNSSVSDVTSTDFLNSEKNSAYLG